jgi:hypothetical protein
MAVLGGQGGQLGLQQHRVERMWLPTSASRHRGISGQQLAKVLLVDARVKEACIGISATATGRGRHERRRKAVMVRGRSQGDIAWRAARRHQGRTHP